MKLEKLTYSQHLGGPAEWKFDELELEDVNLLVGRNSSGKTRTLNVIAGLSNLLGGDRQPNLLSGDYNAVFNNGGETFEYELKVSDCKVTHEVLKINGQNRLVRGAGGVGTLWAEKEQKDIEFQTPETELACVARRDSIQHSYFEPLSQWGKSVFHYFFGSDFGKNTIAFTQANSPELNLKDTSALLKFFRKGRDDFKAKFLTEICSAMCDLGYDIEEVGLGPPTSVTLTFKTSSGLPLDVPEFFFVKERSLSVRTDQFDMSQGMFRALAIIIHLTYARLSAVPNCIIIDDIGEGLDFERSRRLITLLIKQTSEANIQLIMSTNDRFIMNHVPLSAWSVLQREGGVVKIYNHKNSKELFDGFAMTGLNNFDFFSMDIVKNGLGE